MKKNDLSSYSKEELIQLIEKNTAKDFEHDKDLQIPIDFKSLLEATSDIIFVIDQHERFVYSNNAWRSFYPSMSAYKVGDHYSKYIPDIEKKRADFVFHSVINEGKVFENEIMKTYNEKSDKAYFLTSFSPIRSKTGEIMGLIGIMKNITEKHFIEKRLKENTKILEEKVKEQLVQSDELKGLRDLNEEIINNAPIGIFMMDRSGVMLSENPVLMKIMGRKPDEPAVGVNLLEYPGFIEAGFGVLLERCLDEKKTISVKNVTYVPLVGNLELIINVIMTPVLDKSGSVEKVIIMVEDNTEQARITKRIYRAEKLSAVGFLASGIATKLSDPINRMYMDINFVENNVDRDSPASEYVNYLKKELHIIKNMSEQLVALAETEESEREICEINKIITTHPMDVLLHRLTNKGIKVKLNLPEESPKVKALPKQLKQILFDIIENAEEAMPENQGSLEVSVGTMAAVAGEYVIISIRDTGIGIPEENLKRIFQPFFTTKGAEASGLGLMIASNIIENLRGSIGVKSKPGEGTEIRIALPTVIETKKT